MDIIDLSPEYEDTYCKCLEDWSTEMDEAGDYKRRWMERKKSQGLRVKLARDESGRIVGMIHCVPSAHAPIEGEGLYYVYCVWVHGYKEGVGNQQKRGIGTALLEAAEKDCREAGAKGMAAWGIVLPFFMRSKWFKKHGYVRADREGMLELVWKPFAPDASPPRLLKLKKRPSLERGVVSVTCLRNGWCPAQNLSCERMKRAAAEFPERVRYAEVDTEIPENLREWGASDAIFLNDTLINTGPPPSYEKLRKLVRKAAAGAAR
jgi:GNAT superfamily N-acetyltransferase